MPTANQRRQPIGTATYKGRSYAILFAGATKYGDKLKLAFPDNLEQEFWIPRGDAQRVELHDNHAGDDAAWNERRREQRPRQHVPQHTERAEQPDPAADEPCFCSSCGQLLPGEVPL